MRRGQGLRFADGFVVRITPLSLRAADDAHCRLDKSAPARNSLWLLCKIDANQFAIVPGKDAPHCESRVRPNSHAPLDGLRWFNHFGAAELLVPLARKSRKDEIALFVRDDDAIILRDEKRVPPPIATRGIERFPNDVAGFCIEA